MTAAGKVLVFGDDTRAFLAVVRSLGRRGVAVHVAPANLRAPALASRYIAAVHALPPWMGDGRAWVAALEALLRAERFALVIPCDETALLPLQRHRARLETLARLAIPDDDAIAVLFDKHATRELAQRLGIPVPAGRLPLAGDSGAALLAALGSPVVVKPRWSYRLDRLHRRGRVQLVQDATALASLLAEGACVVERFVPGHGLGVSLLASRGRVLQAFEHHRVREDSAGSYYRVSAALTPELLQACTALVATLGYTGLAMFEFRRDPATARWVLLEVNARPWGSLPLAVGCEVDFPWRWYRLLTEGEEAPASGYRAGVFGRNLVPDLQSVLAAAKGRRLAALGGWLAELVRVPLGREIHDVLVRDDPRPALAELGGILGEAARRGAARLPGRMTLGRLRTRARVRAALRRGDGGVVFVCLGNTCRSPFAAALLRVELAGRPWLRVGSAGMLALPGRPASPLGVQTATAYGVDLTGHRSAWLARDAAEAAALLVVFDETTRRALLDRYPGLRARAVRLGDLADGAEIADPVDGDAAVFAATYAAIATGVRQLTPFAKKSNGFQGLRPWWVQGKALVGLGATPRTRPGRTIFAPMDRYSSATAPASPDEEASHLLLCCDANYLQHAAVFLVSLMEHNPQRRFSVVLACDALSPDTQDRFDRTLRRYAGLQLRFSPVLGTALDELPINQGLTREAWGRLWIERYFPAGVRKAFYFDPDMVVTGDLGGLLETDLGDHLLAAVDIPGSARIAAHGYDPRHGYFNSGVLIVNLEKWRDGDRRGALIAYTNAFPGRISDPDQDALNGCFHADRLHLDYVWNAISPFFRAGSGLALPPAEIARVRRDVRLVHFNGASKPWTFMCNHPRKADYLRFLRMTAWRDYRYPDRTPLNVVKKAAGRLIGEHRIARIRRALGLARR